MGIRFKNIPQKCADCESIRPYADYFICGMPETNPELAQMDVSTYRVNPDSKPEWCKLDKLNESFKNLNKDQELALKGLTALFGNSNILEDDDKRELARIVRCKDCKKRKDCVLYEISEDGNWFCADGLPMI